MKEALRSDPRLPPPPLGGGAGRPPCSDSTSSCNLCSKDGLFARYSCWIDDFHLTVLLSPSHFRSMSNTAIQCARNCLVRVCLLYLLKQSASVNIVLEHRASLCSWSCHVQVMMEDAGAPRLGSDAPKQFLSRCVACLLRSSTEITSVAGPAIS